MALAQTIFHRGGFVYLDTTPMSYADAEDLRSVLCLEVCSGRHAGRSDAHLSLICHREDRLYKALDECACWLKAAGWSDPFNAPGPVCAAAWS